MTSTSSGENIIYTNPDYSYWSYLGTDLQPWGVWPQPDLIGHGYRVILPPSNVTCLLFRNINRIFWFARCVLS